MLTSQDSVPLKYRSSSDYLASLPPWRRLLARLNWHPVRETEIETWRIRIDAERIKKETERLKQETEQIKKETELIRSETDRLRKENEQLRNEDELLRREDEQLEQEWLRSKRLNAQIAALFCSDGSCSTPAPTTDDGSMPS